MENIFTGRPRIEDAPAYAKYYFDRTAGQDNLIEALNHNAKQVHDFIPSLPNEKENFQYADGKWTMKGVLSHIIDTERVFQYRALRFSRHDTTPLAGFEESLFNDFSNVDNRSLTELAAEFQAVRQSTIHLFQYMNLSMIDFQGPANNAVVTPRSLGWMIIGHTIHHCDIIKERYLVEVEESF